MDLATQQRTPGKPAFSIVSILSIIAALLSFHYGAALGFLLAVIAIVLGAIGALMSILPGTRGGILSIVAVGAGAIGIIAALFKLLGHLF